MSPPDREPGVRPTPFTRFVIAHTLAYVPAFLWAAAWIPTAVAADFERLAAAADEAAVKELMMWKMLMPGALAFAVPHVLCIPWVRARDAVRGRALLLGGTALESIAALVYGAVTWARLLAG